MACALFVPYFAVVSAVPVIVDPTVDRDPCTSTALTFPLDGHMGYHTKEWGATVLFPTKQVGDKEWGGHCLSPTKQVGNKEWGGPLFVPYY